MGKSITGLISLWRIQRTGFELFGTLARIGTCQLLTDFLYERALSKVGFAESLERLIVTEMMQEEKFDYKCQCPINETYPPVLPRVTKYFCEEEILECSLSYQLKAVKFYGEYIKIQENVGRVHSLVIAQLEEMHRAVNVLYFIDETLMDSR